MSVELYLGDCLEKMRAIPTASVNAVIADLPYGTTRCAWDAIIPFVPLWAEYNRVLVPGGPVVLTACQPFTSALVMSNPLMFRYSWVWEKTAATGHLDAKRRPLRAHEDILVFCAKAPPYYPQMTHGHARKVSLDRHKIGCVQSSVYGKCKTLTSYDSTDRYPRSVIKFASDRQKQNLHPTQKPLSLMEYLVLTYTRPGEFILDNAMGSGTTGVACVRTDRSFIGMEISEQYFKVAEKRIREAQDQLHIPFAPMCESDGS